MTVETTGLKQLAVLWPYSGPRGDGSTSVGDAIEICARYEKSVKEVASMNDQARAKPVIVDVDREIEVGSEMWLGALEDLPDELTNVYRVIGYDEIPDIRGREFQRSVQLGRK